jgi:transaldolase
MIGLFFNNSNEGKHFRLTLGKTEMKELGVSEAIICPSSVHQAARLAQDIYLSQRPEHRLLAEAMARCADIAPDHNPQTVAIEAAEYFAVLYGVHKLSSGFDRISIQVRVRHSFDTTKTVAAALRLVELYGEHSISPDRLRICIGATWEGIQAAKILEEQHGLTTTITEVLGMAQVVAASQANVSMVAPCYEWIINGFLERGYRDTETAKMAAERILQMQAYLRVHRSKTKLMATDMGWHVFDPPLLQGVDYMNLCSNVADRLNKMPAEDVSEPINVSSTFTFSRILKF